MTNAPDDDDVDPRFVDLLTGFDAALAENGPSVGWDAPTLPHDLRIPFEQARACLLLLARVWPRPEAPPEAATPLPERLSRFRVERLLGRGSFGTVYWAHDPATDGPLAVKVLHRDTPDGIGRFKLEFRTLANVVHRNLVNFHELIRADDSWLITMELIEGTDLRSYLRSAPTDWERLRAVLRQLASGVHALHDAGILHRDLKPHNVLVTRAGAVKVVDCGLATYLAAQDGRPTYLAGTVGYMSPEQAACLPLSRASDWYSVGVMLYEALIGDLPFTGTVSEVLGCKQVRDPRPPALPGVPDDLATLCEDLLRREPADRPAGAEVLRRLGSPTLAIEVDTVGAATVTAFVGRSSELARLHESFQQARRQAQVVCVYGPSGIGKSTLVEHFLEQLRTREGAVTLIGRCHERESMPFKAFDSVVDALMRHLQGQPNDAVTPLLPTDVGLLARVFPAFRTLGEIGNRAAVTPHVNDPVEFRRRAFQALRHLLGRLARQRPLVVVIDDLQWGDEDSAQLLVDLLAPPDPPPFLLLGCCRSENIKTSSFIQSLVTASAIPGAASLEVQQLEVSPLGDVEARDLAEALLGEAASPQRASQIASESGGMPIFLEQLARSVWTQPPGIDRDVNLRAVIRRRVGQLPAEALALLETVAVAGQPIRQQDAFGAARIGAQRRDVLTVLQTGQFVRTTGPGAGDLVEAYHSRIRDAVCADMAPWDTKRHHLNLAVTLRSSERADPEAVSDHFLAAGEDAPAAEFAERAADRAVESVAFDRAARLYRRVLELTPPAPKHRELRCKLADALSHAGRGAEAGPEYLTLAAGCSGLEQVDFRRKAAHQFLVAGLFERGMSVIEAVLDAVGTPYPRTTRGKLVALLWQRFRLWLRGSHFRCSSAPIDSNDRIRLEAYWTAFVAMGNMDNLLGASFATRHLRLALRLGNPEHLAIGFACEAFVIGVEPSGRSKSRQLLKTAEELASRSTDPYPAALISVIKPFQSVMDGRWRETVALADEGVAFCRRQCPAAQPETLNALMSTFHALFHLGELRDLSHRLTPLLREADERGNVLLFVFLRTGYCNSAWLAADDPQAASAEVQAAMERWPSQQFHFAHYWALVAECHIDLYQGRFDDACRRLEDRWAALAGSHLLRVPLIRIDMWNLRARCALAKAAVAQDPRPLLQAAERDARNIERERAGWPDPLARLLRAEVAYLRGNSAGAAEHLVSASREFDAVEMGLYAAIARRCLGQLRDGEEGAVLVKAANDWMRAQNIKRPDRIAFVFAPGFPKEASDNTGPNL